MNETKTIENKGTMKKAAVALCVAAVLAMGGVMSYLTATDTAVNKFEASNAAADFATKISVEEPNWDLTDDNGNGIPDAAEGFLPNQSIAKDPQVKNASDIDCYAVIKVAVPTENVKVGDAATAAQTELFKYTVNSGWVEQGTGVYDADAKTTTHTYLYNAKVAAGATTPTLFDTVSLVDLAAGQLAADNLAKDLVVTADAIQALGFASAAEAFAAM